MRVEPAKRARRPESARIPRARRVHVLALADSTPLPVVGVADLLRKAMEIPATLGMPAPPAIEVAIVSPTRRARLRAAGGLELACDLTVHDAPQPDVLVVSALDPDVEAHLAANRDAVDYVRRVYARGADVMSLCTGAFVLAEAGLLDGREVATHWAFAELLRARYPRVRVAPDAVVVDHGRICTAGGATSFLPMTMLLVERLLGADVARAASRMFLIDVNKSPQRAYAMFASQKLHGDEGVLRAQRAIERDLSVGVSVEELARVASTSVRTFARRFKAATGNTPRDYVQRVRVEAAKRALEAGGASVAEVAAGVGFSDAVAFRRLFVAHTGLTPTDYRARYGPRAAPVWVVPKRRRARRAS